MHESRRHRRLKIPLQVEIHHESLGSLLVEASDMSDGGVFVLLDECFQLDLGELVTVKTLGLGADGSESGPALFMRVARKTDTGMGLSIEEAPPNLEAEHGDSSVYVSPQQSILQSLFIVNAQEKVLLTLQGDHWRLPSRELISGESWQDGIERSLAQLEQDEVLSDTEKLEASLQCFPSSDESSPFIDMVIPCRLSNEVKNEESPTPNPYRWIEISKLTDLNSNLDPVAVDNILSQV
ncbi:MAG: hypothetical protein GKR91_04600 [Pseudomonadales bacterium]|nr:hypothetical protein [Pseudomonadales bacterium]